MSRHAFHFARFRRLPLLAVAICLVTHVGCSIFPSSSSTENFQSKHPVLPPIQASPDAIQLEVYFLERPAEDPLLASGVWKEVDQIGALPARTRETLFNNGFRVGHASSNPPPSVQKLLGMVAEIPADAPESLRPLMGRHQFLSPGIETEIPTGIEYPACDFQIRDGDREKTLEYERVSCVLRMKAHRLQDGWVRVDFQPEIHHGDKLMRRTPTDEGWALRGGQNVDVLQSQRFSVTMNVGELALITSTSDERATLGERFFCREDRGTKKQRVLIVRIIDSGHSH